MSQRRIKKALMGFGGIKLKKLKTLFYVKGKAIEGMVSMIGEYHFIPALGRKCK